MKMGPAAAKLYIEEYGSTPKFVCGNAMWRMVMSTSEVIYYPCTADCSYCPKGAKVDERTCTHQDEVEPESPEGEGV